MPWPPTWTCLRTAHAAAHWTAYAYGLPTGLPSGLHMSSYSCCSTRARQLLCTCVVHSRCCPAVTSAPIYTEGPNNATTPMDVPVSGNVLDHAKPPAGQTATVTGFSLPGSNKVIPAGATANVTDPVTGELIGTLNIASNGAYTFDPVPGFTGPVPTANVYSSASGGLSAISTLNIDVGPGNTIAPASFGGRYACRGEGTWGHVVWSVTALKASGPLTSVRRHAFVAWAGQTRSR